VTSGLRAALAAVAALAALATACATPEGSHPTAVAPTPAPQAAGVPGAAMSGEDLASRIEEYFTKSVSPGITLEARDIHPSDVPGWREGTLAVTSGGDGQEIGFLVTPDGRYFISGEVTDLTVDPLQAVVDKIELEGKPARGPADAPVTIVEYSDFQCPFCGRGYQILEEEVLPAYEGKVRFYFKHLPLKSIHPWAAEAAVATECAGDQSDAGFWALYHRLFKTQRELNEDNLHEKVTAFAKEAGLDETAFAACLDSEEAAAEVERDLAEATEVGANSTPTFFINGRRLEGAQPLDNFKAVIDAELG
jgi:protein-disulfide isomerase